MPYVYGLHAVAALLDRDPGAVSGLWVLGTRKDTRLGRLLDRGRGLGLPVHEVPRQELDRLVGSTRHQGVAALSEATETAMGEAGLEGLLDRVDGPPLLLVLDGVQDPHNLGACLRTADGAGVHGVIAPKDRAVGLTPVVSKVASGAAESVPFVQVTNLARTLKRLAERGIWVVGAAGEATQGLYDTDLTGPLALVLGAEGSGLRRLTREHCDVLVTIPMAGSVASLNVSVAAGVCLYEAVRQRRGPG